MKMKSTALGLVLAVGATLGAVQSANAYVYTRSYLEIDNLQLAAFNTDGSIAAGTVTGYSNSILGVSALNGAPGTTELGQCDLNTCVPNAVPALDGFPGFEYSWAGIDPGNNNFAFQGPGGGEYARTDAVVWESAIVDIAAGGDPLLEKTRVESIAEAQLISGNSALASVGVSSTTDITLNFNISGPVNGFALTFDAVWDQLVEANQPLAAGITANSGLSVGMSLRNDITQERLDWNPGADCTTTFVGGCFAVNSGNLNADIGITTNPDSEANVGAGQFLVQAFGLTEGNYTLVLNAGQIVDVTQTIPVPGSLAIVGLGLTLMGFRVRRRKLS